MARTRQEIVNTLLEKAATDPILDTVSRSLVGKELIYFGANVVYQLEQAGDVLSRYSDLARADAQQLIAYAYTHEVPCSFTKPAIVRVKVNTNTVETYAPFTVYITIGGTRFYNIDFVTTDREFTLYQGTPKAIVSATGRTLDAFSLDSLGVVRQYQNWQLYKEFSEGNYLSSYLKLGESVIPESVRVFARAIDGANQGIVFPYTEYNQSLADPSAKLYKVRTGWDQSINLYFGDTNWAEQVNQELYEYEIYFLEASVTNFTVTTNNTLALGERSLTQRPNADGESFTVSSYSMGETGSLSYARTSILSAQFISQGLITEAQILNYVNSLDTVNSAKILINQSSHSVNVVVKPAEPDNTEFGYLEDTLRQNGAIGVNYNVTVATAVDFNVTLQSVGSQSMQNMTRAKQVIEDYCSYKNITLASQISSATLNQVLQLAGIRDIIALIEVTHEPVNQDSFGAQKLPALPQANSIKMFDGADVLTGFDSDGTFRVISKEPILQDTDTTFNASFVGDFLLLSNTVLGDQLFVDREPSRILASKSTLRDKDGIAFPPNADMRFLQSDSDSVLPFIYGVPSSSNFRLCYFSKSNSIYRGDLSIFNRTMDIRALEEYPIALKSGSLNGAHGGIYYGGYIFLVTDENDGYGIHRALVKDGVAEDEGVVITGLTNLSFSFGVMNNSLWFLKDASTIYKIEALTGGLTQYQIAYQNAESVDYGDIVAFTIKNGIFYVASTKIVNGARIYYIHRYSTQEVSGKLNLIFQQAIEIQGAPASNTAYLNVYDDRIVLALQKGCILTTASGTSLGYIPWANARMLETSGSVDYNTGTVYNVNGGIGSYFRYSVAGVISGDTIYPRYVND